MNKHASLAVFAAIFSAGLCARTAAAGTLGGLKAKVESYAGCEAPPPPGEASIRTPAEVSAEAQKDPKLIDQLETYYAYEAFITGDPARCTPMALLRNSPDCPIILDELLFVSARRGQRAEFLEKCRRNPGGGATGFTKERMAGYCALIEKHWDDVAGLCASLVPSYVHVGYCRPYFASIIGDAGVCDGWKGIEGETAADIEQTRLECRGNAAFVKAFKASNVSLCGESQRCRVLMGDGPKVLAEMAGGLTSPTAQWFIKKHWNLKVKAARPPVAPKTPPSGFKGFACKVIKRVAGP